MNTLAVTKLERKEREALRQVLYGLVDRFVSGQTALVIINGDARRVFVTEAPRALNETFQKAKP